MVGFVNKRTTSQETDMIVAMATRIYEEGAVYRPVEPDMYAVNSPEDSTEAIIMSAHQFHAIVSLVRSMKSSTAIPAY